MTQALFLNGVFEEVLEEIIEAQKADKDLICTLQPYSSRIIKLLEATDFSRNGSIPFYISTTTDLKHVAYTAEIVGWENKKELFNKPERLKELNERIGMNLPIQKEVYLHSDDEKTKECINLIELKKLRKLVIPLSVGNLIKISDGTPYKPRSRPGGWSPVNVVPSELMEAVSSSLEETLQNELIEQVVKSLNDSSEKRQERLRNASKKPEVIQIISKGFKRNPDVIAEVLERAKGVCERCGSEAPFFRKTDNSPYLEVHHQLPLAKGGEDTVQNSVALCPNCHREVHFGV